MSVRIVRTRLFSRSAKRLGLAAAEIADIDRQISIDPKAGDVIPGMRGVRKLRFRLGARGRRGGGRCIYLTIAVDDVVYLLLAYAKSEQEDMTREQRAAILAAIEELT